MTALPSWTGAGNEGGAATRSLREVLAGDPNRIGNIRQANKIRRSLDQHSFWQGLSNICQGTQKQQVLLILLCEKS
jgi:hypothetical protein